MPALLASRIVSAGTPAAGLAGRLVLAVLVRAPLARSILTPVGQVLYADLAKNLAGHGPLVVRDGVVADVGRSTRR